MEIQDFIEERAGLIPIAELTDARRDRGAFGDDVVTAFSRRSNSADAGTTGSTRRERRAATPCSPVNSGVTTRHSRARFAAGLAAAVEQRTDQRGFVPASQTGTHRRRSAAGCLASSCAPWRKAAAPAPSLRRMSGPRTSSTAWRPNP